MMKGLIGKKLGMTQIFDEEGCRIPVTVVEAGPCVVIQKKTIASDGYNAIQVGFDARDAARSNRPSNNFSWAKAETRCSATLPPAP